MHYQYLKGSWWEGVGGGEDITLGKTKYGFIALRNKTFQANISDKPNQTSSRWLAVKLMTKLEQSAF